MIDENQSIDDDDIVDLTSENKAEVLGEYDSEYILSACGNKPRARVTIKSASFSRIQSFQRSAGGTNDKKMMRELCELIAEAVIDSRGNPVWEGSEISTIATANTQRFLEIQHAVLHHNGMDKSGKTIERIEEDERKK